MKGEYHMREKRNKKERIDTPAGVATELFFSGVGIAIIIAAIADSWS